MAAFMIEQPRSSELCTNAALLSYSLPLCLWIMIPKEHEALRPYAVLKGLRGVICMQTGHIHPPCCSYSRAQILPQEDSGNYHYDLELRFCWVWAIPAGSLEQVNRNQNVRWESQFLLSVLLPVRWFQANCRDRLNLKFKFKVIVVFTSAILYQNGGWNKCNISLPLTQCCEGQSILTIVSLPPLVTMSMFNQLTL